MTSSEFGSDDAVVSIPDIRDYEKINAELVQLLDSGVTRVRLAGAEGQRFLASGLVGPWNAVVEVEGWAGPELAAALEAPGLTIVCRGRAADGAGRALRAGRLLITGDAGAALGYSQRGGLILAVGAAGPRAGLNQAGGTLVLLGQVGRLAGERQAGGLVFAFRDRLGPYAGRAQRGGRFVSIGPGSDGDERCQPLDLETFNSTLRECREWIGIGPFDSY